MRIARATPLKVDNILQLIGNTPLVRLNRVNPVPGVELLVKLESMNPGGSVKDRIGLAMVEEAEARGELTPGKIVLEASSGNTAIGLAMVCAVKGYQLLVTMSESASEERKRILKAYGAEILLTPGAQGTDGAIEEAYRLAREEPEKYFLVDQFNNQANWLAHYEGTGKEIWEATEGRLDVAVVAMGTTGTLMGICRALRDVNPAVRVVGVEPYKAHKIQGLKNMKESYPPGIFRPEEPDAIVNVADEAAYEMARRLAREEGIFVGMSAGAAVKVAIDEARTLGQGTVVTLLPDGGERYLSTSLFADKPPKPLNFYNTLTGKVDPLSPLQAGKIGLYCCGPSLDGPPDLGLCRRLVFTDVLRRHLVSRGYAVKYVMNLGDIDDRTVRQCLASGQNLKQFTEHWEEVFFQSLEALRIGRAAHCPRASEHVPDMIRQTQALLEKGLAYEKLRSVYFRISGCGDYGKLSGVSPHEVRSETSTVYDYYEKDNPRDFALFKRATLAELKAGIYWDTPWGKARPGWHVECSSMAARYLGQSFDIHTASADLVFPHGDNEIAIAGGLCGSSLARLWMHCEVVMADGKKVSRAAENDLSLADLLEQGFDSRTVRYWLLATHYRSVLTYSKSELSRAEQAVARLNALAGRLRSHMPGAHADELDAALEKTREAWRRALDHDLNLPAGLGRLFGLVRLGNRLLNEGKMDQQQVEQVLNFLDETNEVLAVIETPSAASDEQIEAIVNARNAARQSGDFARADQLREQLRAMGIQIWDGPKGTTWKAVRG